MVVVYWVLLVYFYIVVDKVLILFGVSKSVVVNFFIKFKKINVKVVVIFGNIVGRVSVWKI